MKVKDVVENYLLSIGVSLKNTYSYLPKREYDYSGKEKTESATLGKYDVKLSKKIRNTRELFVVFNIARNNFVNNVTINGDFSKCCDKLFSSAILYYADFIKYIVKNFDIKIDLVDKLIVLVNRAIENTEKEIGKVASQYNVDMNKVREHISNKRAEMTAQAIA